ncbi:hypothetical protein A0O34_09270 [Chryseobacterium glaciei]|uniref:Glycosyltransferase RgtA/B/C/D-like domain-containing protein n=1 Tax=Chryseobacterium glaciei TaxID=1685010 RepID=A0A172XUJ6_9FLAO|nr:DUF6056 family protein [Chryseobacterium glaciei]ANF50699.1 hypothetical protein A0O34_09270 [Chryseobacterium glaciei]
MKSVQNIVLFLSIFTLIGLMYIAYFNVYQTDDYIYSYGTRKLGFLNNSKSFYLNWGGRYFGYSINTLNPVSEDNTGILPKVYPVFLFLSFIGLSVLNFKQYFKYSLKEATVKGFILFFFYTVLLVSIPEHYFWITGSNIYFLPIILFGFLLYFLGKYAESKSRIWFYLLAVLIVILMGSNELSALILLGSLAVFYYQKRTKETQFLLILGLLFCLVSFLAPGNFKRLDDSTGGFLMKSIKRIGIFGVNNIFFFIKTSLIMPLFIKIFESELRFIIKKINFKKALIIWSVSFLPLIFTAYIMNTMGRQFENIIFFYFVSSSVLWFFMVEKIKKYWWVSLVIIFLPETNFLPEKYSNFNFDFNINTIGKEILFTDLKKYDQEIENRINTIKNSKKDSLIIDRIKTVPKILYFDEMSSVKEDKNYVSEQLQKYFDKKYIRVED